MTLEMYRTNEGNNTLTLVQVGDILGLEFDLASSGAIEYFEARHRAEAIQRCLVTDSDNMRDSCRRLLGLMVERVPNVRVALEQIKLPAQTEEPQNPVRVEGNVARIDAGIWRRIAVTIQVPSVASTKS